jgi:hypothetical protein
VAGAPRCPSRRYQRWQAVAVSTADLRRADYAGVGVTSRVSDASVGLSGVAGAEAIDKSGRAKRGGRTFLAASCSRAVNWCVDDRQASHSFPFSPDLFPSRVRTRRSLGPRRAAANGRGAAFEERPAPLSSREERHRIRTAVPAHNDSAYSPATSRRRKTSPAAASAGTAYRAHTQMARMIGAQSTGVRRKPCQALNWVLSR